LNSFNENQEAFSLDRDYFLVDGKYFGHNDRCYIPIFRHHLEEKTGELSADYILGSHIMQQYTFMFDNSPMVEHSENKP